MASEPLIFVEHIKDTPYITSVHMHVYIAIKK